MPTHNNHKGAKIWGIILLIIVIIAAVYAAYSFINVNKRNITKARTARVNVEYADLLTEIQKVNLDRHEIYVLCHSTLRHNASAIAQEKLKHESLAASNAIQTSFVDLTDQITNMKRAGHFTQEARHALDSYVAEVTPLAQAINVCDISLSMPPVYKAQEQKLSTVLLQSQKYIVSGHDD